MGISIDQWRSSIGALQYGTISATGYTAAMRNNPLLLVVITLLLMIGGIELNPGPRPVNKPQHEQAMCEQTSEVQKQVQLMCDLGTKYAMMAKETSESWQFLYATSLYNAALRLLNKHKAENIKGEVKVSNDNQTFNDDSISDKLQQIEIDFLQSVSHANVESKISQTAKHKSALQQLRSFSTHTINDIHNQMKIDTNTLKMSATNETHMISQSKIYFDNLACKLIEFYKMLVDECILVLGVPDCRFSILGLGSLGRKESTPWSDLQLVLIYEPAGKTPTECKKVKNQLKVIIQYFHLKIINLGETLLQFNETHEDAASHPEVLKMVNRDNDPTWGMHLDNTWIMKKKGIAVVQEELKDALQLIMTVDEMLQNIKDVSNFQDLLVLSSCTLIFGEGSLMNQYTERLHASLMAPSNTNRKRTKGEELGKTYLEEYLRSHKRSLMIDSLKTQLYPRQAIYRFATISVNILKLIYQCCSLTPLDILEELYQKQILTERAKKDLQIMVCIGIKMEHLMYSRYDQGQADPPASNFQQYENLTDQTSVGENTVIDRFFATYSPWFNFLESNSNDITNVKHEQRYLDSSDKIRRKIQEEISSTKKEVKGYGIRIQTCGIEYQQDQSHLTKGGARPKTENVSKQKETTSGNKTSSSLKNIVPFQDKSSQHHKQRKLRLSKEAFTLKSTGNKGKDEISASPRAETNEQAKSLAKPTVGTKDIQRTYEILHLVNCTKRICSVLTDETTADLANIENQFLQKLTSLENQIGIDTEVDTTEHQGKLVVIKGAVDLTYDKGEMFDKVLQVLQEESKWIKNRLENLESGIQKHFFQVLKNLFVQHQRTDKFINRQEESIKQLDTAMADSQLAVHNGIMILPIEDFQAKFQAAKVRDPASITSPAFYTRRGGYKLKIRVYLNGDGLGLGTHVSIYIMMCKSPFDALLPWPFNQKITLGIMNQLDSKKDYMDAFRPNKALNTWGKPVAESNVPTGIPKFLDLATVLDPSQGYVVDDTMYVKVIIEQEPKTPLSAFLGYKEIEEQ